MTMSEPAIASATPRATARSGWSLAIAVLIGALALMLAVRQVDWKSVAGAVAHVSIAWLALGALGLAAVHVLLAVRWRVLVNAGDRLPLGDAFDFIMIGTLAGLVSSSRLGDVARAIAAGRLHAHGEPVEPAHGEPVEPAHGEPVEPSRDLSASRLLGTILVERLFDVIMLLGFGAALAVLMAIPPLVRGALATLFIAALALAIVLWMGEEGPLGIAGRWLARLTGPTSRGSAMFGRFVGGIGAVHQQGRAAPALAVALLVWICAAAAASCNLAAFGVSAPWYAGAFVVVVVNLGGVIPAPPAGIGVYDYLAMIALSPWVADSSTAFAFALVTHALSVALVAALGSFSLVRQGLSFGGIRRMVAAGVRDELVR